MYKACIFDLDGTIADTVESIAYVGNQTLRHFHLPELPVENYNFYAGDGADELVRRMLQAVPGGDKVDYEEVRVLYRKWFGENPFYHVKPFEGILELLEGLKKEGLKIAVFSINLTGRLWKLWKRFSAETCSIRCRDRLRRFPESLLP